MTDKEIINMAREAGLLNPPQDGLNWSAPVPNSDYLQRIERFADLVLRAERQACAELVQVPVAWMDREGDLYKMPEIEGWAPPHTLLYTAPPQRKPLTNEEIDALLAQSAGVDLKLNGGDLLFARAIERAHGIGGKE